MHALISGSMKTCITICTDSIHQVTHNSSQWLQVIKKTSTGKYLQPTIWLQRTY